MKKCLSDEKVDHDLAKTVNDSLDLNGFILKKQANILAFIGDALDKDDCLCETHKRIKDLFLSKKGPRKKCVEEAMNTCYHFEMTPEEAVKFLTGVILWELYFNSCTKSLRLRLKKILF